MPFDRDGAIKANQAKALKLKVDEANSKQTTFKQDTQAARRSQESIRRQDVTRYYITTPLALADDSIKGNAVKLEIQIPAGPTPHKDEEGKYLYREMGVLVLLEGEGVTTDPLWAEWLAREFPEWTVSELAPTGLASYAQEIAEARGDLQLQGA